ncbi:unnamed protein product [Urochloa decumbens]|uniref:Uncharacterized protein n=1 Tax=Urochloa decumbens TaxID=240449 RepID=A0ABC9FXZ7_9POAL
MMINRRFVNIVAENYKNGMYSLHRLDVSKHLFYPSAAEADAAASMKNGAAGPAAIPRLERLPPPCISFQPTPTSVSDWTSLPFFALASPRRSEGRIITCTKEGDSVVYDADSNSNQVMPSMRGYKGIQPTSIISTGNPDAEQEDLYVLHSGFHVLRFGSADLVHDFPGSRKSWHWDSLPRPPINDTVRSHTVIDGGRTICLSSFPDRFGTCCFDTVEREWWHAGYWELPFEGGVEYIPDLGLWLGFSPEKPNHLCATSDLADMEQPPEVSHVLEDLDTPRNWFPIRAKLINLGGGRFCVARVFQEVVMDTEDESEDLDLSHFYQDLDLLGHEFSSLTGVELVTSGSSGGKKLEGIRIHKSIRYIFSRDMIRWEL